MAAAAAREVADLPLGARVRAVITGTIVGRSEIIDGPPSYWVQYEIGNKTVRKWMRADQIEEVGDE